MDAPRILIVYYSRSGNTRNIAYKLAAELGCEVEELIDTRNRRGLLGYLRSGFDGWAGRSTRLQRIQHDPADYDLVVVGTPVWSRSVSAPVRTYLKKNCGGFRQLAFFLTHGGMGRERVFSQMAELVMEPPVATLGVTECELDNAEFLRKVKDFAQELRLRLRNEDTYGFDTPSVATS